MEFPNFVKKFRERIGHYFPSSTTVVSPNSPSTVGLSFESSANTVTQRAELQLELEESSPVVAAETNNFDRSMLFMAFCLTSGVEITLYSLQAGNGGSRNRNHDPDSLPLCFQLLSFAILLAFTLLFVGRFIKSNYPAESELLERAGILFATTAFFHVMTMPLSLFLKGCSWGVYLFSLLAIAICNYY
ncbi:uncharacterized protein LOC125857860 [Solanum stenotomum]|uniref:uncharacterized protein LOC125857860 n=1 Tax=Solanum stenotomum TaxID=172797 RepID=UPI0020D10E21|nr:uncharacterized protein LOC125857860 [Solanum stenotomum]